MSLEEAHDWAKKQREAWDKSTKEIRELGGLNKELSSGGDHPVRVVTFATTERPSFRAEVGTNDHGDLIFHFWPTPDENYHTLVMKEGDGPAWAFGALFPDALAISFIEVFKYEDKLFWDFVAEMNSWVVRAAGFGKNILSDKLAAHLFDVLQKRLEK